MKSKRKTPQDPKLRQALATTEALPNHWFGKETARRQQLPRLPRKRRKPAKSSRLD